MFRYCRVGFRLIPMLYHPVLTALVVFGALALDLGLPAWTSAAVLPSFLDVVFVVLVQTTGGAALVFWSGLIGLATDVVDGRSFGAGVMSLATLGLAAAIFSSPQGQRRSVVDRGLSCLLWLALLGSLRLGIESVSLQLSPALLAPQILSQSAAGCLACAILTLTHAAYSAVRGQRIHGTFAGRM